MEPGLGSTAGLRQFSARAHEPIYSLDVALSGKGSGEALREARGSVAKAAENAELHRSTLYEKAGAVRLAGASEDSGGGVNERSGFV